MHEQEQQKEHQQKHEQEQKQEHGCEWEEQQNHYLVQELDFE